MPTSSERFGTNDFILLYYCQNYKQKAVIYPLQDPFLWVTKIVSLLGDESGVKYRQKMNRDVLQIREVGNTNGILQESSGIVYTVIEKTKQRSDGPSDKETAIQETTAALPAYSVFSTRRKKCAVWLIALASWFSPASSFIYFPAIVPLAESLGVSVSKINATVTSYLVVAAVAPTVLGHLADELGRRPVIISMLIIYILANIGLAVQSSYAALLLLRMLQSAGMSG
jgi:hypothetical protein